MVRVALVYLAVAWALVQGAETLTRVLDLPEFTDRLVFALLVLGFPVSGVALTTFAGGRSDGDDFVGTSLDAHLVAVLPFRVNAPEALSYLGAGRVVTGAVVGDRSWITVTAELASVPGGERLAGASAAGDPDSIAQLEQILEIEPPGDNRRPALKLSAATILEEQGDPSRALDMLDRISLWTPQQYRWGLASFERVMWLRMAQLSAQVGDPSRAVREYQRWLKLHGDAEPPLFPEVEAVRAEVARLEGLHSASTGPTR